MSLSLSLDRALHHRPQAQCATHLVVFGEYLGPEGYREVITAIAGDASLRRVHAASDGRFEAAE